MTTTEAATAVEQDQRSVRRPAEPTGIASVDNAIHSVKADLMDTEDRLIKRMDERFDAVDADLKAIKDHLGVDDGS